MTDKTPGKVLSALLVAQRDVDNVRKRQTKGDQTAYQEADEVLAVAYKALTDAGLVYQLDLSPPASVVRSFHGRDGESLSTEIAVTARLRVWHPDDGSSLEWSAVGLVLINKMGLYGGVANSRAAKQVLRFALGITTGASEEDHRKPEPMPEPLPPSDLYREILGYIDGCTTFDELREVGKHYNSKALDPDERGRVKAEIERRRQELGRLGASDYVEEVRTSARKR